MTPNKLLLSGITLLELLVVIAILAILLGIGVPNLQQVINNSRVAAQSNELVAMLHLARSQAVRLNASVEVWLDTDAEGWTGRVYVEDCTTMDADDNAVDCQPADGCPLIDGFIRCTTGSRVTLSGMPFPQTLTFNKRGYLAVSGSPDWAANTATVALTHPQCRGGSQNRQIIILPTGQIEASSLPCP